MQELYTEKLMEHLRNPRNVGKIESADGVGKAGNPVCGDVMYLYIKVKDDTIVDIKFQTLGCGAAIATSSMVTELAKGQSIEEAMKISRKDIAAALGGLPPIKWHCSVLAEDALVEAIRDYLIRKGKPVPEELEAKHVRIKREEEEIEARYAAYLKAQEEAFKKST